MKFKLPTEQTNTRAYGFTFDDKGICTADKKDVQSLLDAKLVVEVKAKSKK